MKAAVMHGREDIRIEGVTKPEPQDGELLIAVETVGICGTDASEYSRGPAMFPIEVRNEITGHLGPMVPGHEFSGVVTALGRGVQGFEAGDLVASGAGVSCGACSRCKRGQTNLCVRYNSVGLERNGALAEYVTAPASACMNLANRGMTADLAALAQPMSIAIHAMRRGRLLPEDDALIIGTGGIGTFLTLAASSTEANLTVADLMVDRLKTASLLGAHRTVAVDSDSSLVDMLGGPGSYDVVYECTGVPKPLQDALSLVRPGGRVVAVGIPKGEIPINVNRLVLKEKELIGTLAHAFASDFPLAIDLLEKSSQLMTLIAPEVFPLESLVPAGIEPMVQGNQKRIKMLFSPRLDAPRPIGV